MPETAAPAPPLYQCRHIFPTGNRCGSRALRKEYFCFYHNTARPPFRVRKTVNGPFDDPVAIELPTPEDRTAVLQGIAQVIDRLAANTLDPRRAGLLLYAFQICASILPKPAKDAEPIVTVDEVILDPIHGPIAPETEIHLPKTLRQIIDGFNPTLPIGLPIPTLQACAETPLPTTSKSRLNPLPLNTLDTSRGEGVQSLQYPYTAGAPRLDSETWVPTEAGGPSHPAQTPVRSKGCPESPRITMPKLKTHSGAAKRFTRTGTGKFKRGHSKMRHILTSKNNATKSRLGKSGLISDADHYNVSRMLPYA